MATTSLQDKISDKISEDILNRPEILHDKPFQNKLI